MTASIDTPEIPQTRDTIDKDYQLRESGSSSSAAIGRWEELDGNFILRPSIEEGPPRALGMFSLANQ